MNQNPRDDNNLIDDSPAETSAQLGEPSPDQDSEPGSVPSGAAADEEDHDDQDSGPSSEPAGAADADEV